VFDTLDQLREKPKVTPKAVMGAFFYVFLLGAMLGILLGRRAWAHWEAWGQLVLYSVLGWKIVAPVLDKIKKVVGSHDN
jgi:hypothetical protein